MNSPLTPTHSIDNVAGSRVLRTRCYACYRPVDLCFCHQIPSIDNRTHVLILQHMRERFHPFNTARIVRQALQKSTLLVDHNAQLAQRLNDRRLHPNVGVLYPGPGGRQLSELSPEQRPDELIIIDGTWHHAKTLVRDIALLNRLPRYQIVPANPGQYRIRREPNATALSTLEATVSALQAIEPETEGFGELSRAFDSMVQTQLDHPKADYGWRQNAKRSNNPMGIPRAIIHDLPNIVVAYGESEPGKTGCKRSPRGSDKRQPVYWVARRLGTGESFREWIEPRVDLPDHFLSHLKVRRDSWSNAVTTKQFCDRWNGFLQPSDTVVVYHNSTLGLLENVGAAPDRCVILKSVKFDPQHEHATLDAYLRGKQIVPTAPADPGRAGERLANGIAMVHHLHQLGRQFAHEPAAIV